MVPTARVSPVESRGQDDDAFARVIFGELLAERSGVSKSCTLRATKHDKLQQCMQCMKMTWKLVGILCSVLGFTTQYIQYTMCNCIPARDST